MTATPLRTELPTPCCPGGRVIHPHGWTDHPRASGCETCGRFGSVQRRDEDGAHLCPRCDSTWAHNREAMNAERARLRETARTLGYVLGCALMLVGFLVVLGLAGAVETAGY